MAVITAITPDPKKEGRVVVSVEGKPAVSVSADAVARLGLHVGAAYGESQREAAEREAASLATFDRALNVLAFRARSVGELRRSLLRKGEPAEHVESAIERLVRVGLLNDADFARQFARSKVTGSGFSKRRLQSELARKSVAREVADAAIADVLADEDVDQDAILEQAARKKLRTLSKLDPQTRKRRLFAFLARRGFEFEDITRVVSAIGDE